MKRILSILGVVSIFFVISSIPVFAFKAEPVLRSPFNQWDRFDTDLFTGSAVYSQSIPVPKGTNDLTPKVALDYSSGGVQDPSAYTGIGWQLQRDYIERDANYTPGSTSDDKFRLYFQGSSQELVYVSSESRYHTKTESHLHITKITTGASNDSGEYWQVITKDGTKYTFGKATNSELMCNSRSYVYRWNLEQVEDTHGNKIFYTYTESNGASYLSKIEYNTEKARVIDFNYATNPYTRAVYIQGCNITETSRLSNIQVKVSANLIRQFDLSYTNASNLQQLLTGITEKGSDGTSALPTTTLEYKPEVQTWATQSAKFLDNAAVDAHLQMERVALADVNGDGLTDIVRTYDNSPNNGWGTWKVLLNQSGNNWSTSYETWITSGFDAWLGRTDTALIDVTGDGRPDIVKTDGISGSNSTWKVWRNTGSSWSTTQETWINNASIDAYLGKDGIGLADANGDGLVDIVKSYNHDVWKVNLNTGSSWSTTDQTWATQLDAKFTDTDTRVLDVTGDGLPDIVQARDVSTVDTWKVWKNTGNTWINSPETWLASSTLDVLISQQEVALSDVNGDGLPDIIKSIDGGTQDTWKVLLNNGNSWSTSWVTWIQPSDNVDADAQAANVRLADVNGDGLTDIVKTTYSGGNDTWNVWKNNGYSPDLLAKVTTSQGGSISFDYLQSSTLDNSGADTVSDLPFNLWLVQTMTTKNGMTGTHATTETTQYSYKDGLYDHEDREFRGFGEINTTEPNTAKKKYLFNQDDILKGTLSEMQHRNSNNDPFAETEDTWSSSTANGVNTVQLTTEKQYTYDGTASNPKIVETNYTYDSYGNPTKISEKGDTSITTDDRFTYFEYVYNTTAWIVDTAKKTYKNASNDSTKVSETTFYYDGNTGLDDTPTKGDVTKGVKWLSGGTSPITLYAYNTYGNLTSVTDANNHATTYAFGTTDTTRTYPDSVTNAKNQTTTFSYNLGTGNLNSTTDPNGQTTSYEYDVFGRITKEIKPYDNSTYPTTSYTYSFDGTAPEGTLVSKREVSGASGTVDIYTFIDGLGRTIQVRSDAENTSNQNVVNTFYGTNGKVNKQTVPHVDTLSTSYVTPITNIRSTQMAFDVLSRPTTITNPDDTTNTNAYDHWLITKTNERGKVTKHTINAFEKIIKVEEVNGASTYTTDYTYNARDELTNITDHEDNEFDFTYDTLGRKTEQSDPDMGTWTYAYDGVGNLTSQTDNRSVTISKTYDELNRVTLVNYPNDTDSSFLYDSGKIGTLSIATDSAGTVFYSYDNRLRKTQEQRAINGTTKTTQFSFDPLDRVVTTTYPDGEVVTNTFNNQGEINSASGSASLVSNIDYNALGKITRKEFANGLSTDYTYSSTSFRLTRIQTGSIQDLNYAYDNIGNVASITNSIASKTQYFGYDDLDRLKIATESAGFNYAYEYSPVGNLTKFTNNATSQAIDYTYGEGTAGPHAVTSSNETVFTTTLSATEDTYVDGSATSSNFGSNTSLSVDGDPVKISYMKFDLSSINGATVTNAKLRLYVTNESLDTQVVKEVSTNSWAEGTMTYTNKPSLGSTIATLTDASTPNAWKEIDITSAINAHTGETYSIALDSTGADGLAFNASESTANQIELVVSYTGGAAGGATSVTTTNLTTGTDTDGNASATTASVTPGGNKLQLLTVASRTSITTDPNQPTISGNGLTWVQVGTSLFDDSGSTRRRITVFRAMGASPSSGTVSISFGGQNQTHVAWSLDEFSGVDTSGTNGSGAIVQSVVNQDTTETATLLTATLAAFSGTNNATFGVFGTGADFTETVGSGFTLTSEATTISLSAYTEFKNTNDTTVDMSWSSAQGIGAVALELKAASATSTVTAANTTTGSDTDGNSSASTASVTPGANKLQLLTVSSRTSITADPNEPSVSGNGLTWVKVGTSLFDNSGSTRRRVTVFRAMGASPTAGAISIDFGGQNQTHVAWTLDEFSNVDTSGTNGSGAIVQSVVNQDTSETATSLTGTLAAFSGTNNATFGAFGTGADFTETVGSGFTLVGKSETISVTAYSEFKNTNDTTVDMSWNSAQGIGVIAVEIKAGTSAGSGMTYTYDANGNMTSDGTKCYEFNEANQMKKVKICSGNVTIAEYVYDYNGNRMVKKNYSNGSLTNTVYSWSDLYETKVIVGGSTESTSYYFVYNELIAKKNNDGSKYYYHNDHLGSTAVLTNQSGTLVEETKYDPWGEVRAGGTESKFLYTGQEKDAETGLNYYNFRYYDSHIRRFTQPDDIIQNVFDPQTLNRYAYVRNNPLKYTDPTGHFFSTIMNVVRTAKSLLDARGSGNAAPAPKPASTAKLPSNPSLQNVSINLPSNNTNTVPTHITDQNPITSTIINIATSVQNNSIVKTATSVKHAYDIRIEAEDAATTKIGHLPNGSKRDAYRHAHWMYRTTKEGNYAGALIAGAGHEIQNVIQDPIKGRGLQWQDYKMDMYNNAVGATGALVGLDPDHLLEHNLLFYYNGPESNTFGREY